MTNDPLTFRVRAHGAAHPSNTVVATGEGQTFQMTCDCLAGGHAALLCPHIVDVLRQTDLVVTGRAHFAELGRRAAGSAVIDKDNGYWKFYDP